MSLAATASANSPAVDYELIRELAQHQPISPDVVFRRLKVIGSIMGLSLVGIIAAVLLLAFDVPVSEPARLLTALGFAAAAIVLFSSLVSAGVLLWGGFVSQYVHALDARGEVAESFGEAEHQIAQATPVEANEEMVQTVAEEAFAVATAFAEKADSPRAIEGRRVLAEVRAAIAHLEELQRKFNAGENERVFDSLRPRMVIMRQVRLKTAAAGEDASSAEMRAPLVG